jgi:hypothetical protein
LLSLTSSRLGCLWLPWFLYGYEHVPDKSRV